jgi:peptidoglycan hydrolase-like protein with peptidoglycan-binding domain
MYNLINMHTKITKNLISHHGCFAFILVILTALFLFPILSEAQTTQQEISLSEFVELLIALDVIAPDKVQTARDLIKNQTQIPTNTEQNTSPLNLTRNLYKGLQGTDVTALQQFLLSTGDFVYPEITSYYGSITESAVQRYQCREMQICSGSTESNGYGVVGPLTRATLAQMGKHAQ